MLFSVTWDQINSRVRSKVKDAVVCDINDLDPLSGTSLKNTTFDIITSCLCLHVAALNINDFKQVLQNIRYRCVIIKYPP